MANVLNEVEEGVHVLGRETGGSMSQYAMNVLHLGWVFVHLFREQHDNETKKEDSTAMSLHKGQTKRPCSKDLHLPDGGEFLERQLVAKELHYGLDFIAILGLVKVAPECNGQNLVLDEPTPDPFHLNGALDSAPGWRVRLLGELHDLVRYTYM